MFLHKKSKANSTSVTWTFLENTARNEIYSDEPEDYEVWLDDFESKILDIIHYLSLRHTNIKDIDFIILGDEYLQYLHTNKKKHNIFHQVKFGNGISKEERSELWKKYHFENIYQHYFFPITISGLKPGQTYETAISKEIQERLRKLICSLIDVSGENVHIMPHLMRFQDISKEKNYLQICTKAYMEDKLFIKKIRYDSYKIMDETETFLLPVIIKRNIPNQMINISDYLKNCLDYRKINTCWNIYLDIIKDIFQITFRKTDEEVQLVEPEKENVVKTPFDLFTTPTFRELFKRAFDSIYEEFEDDYDDDDDY